MTWMKWIKQPEIRKAMEFPLTYFELHNQIGIDLLRDVLIYGLGCGKTMVGASSY